MNILLIVSIVALCLGAGLVGFILGYGYKRFYHKKQERHVGIGWKDESAPGVALGHIQNQPNMWVVHISHRHGNDYWVCDNEEAAWERLYKYVITQWEKEFPEVDMPEDSEFAIEEYFGKMQNQMMMSEWYYVVPVAQEGLRCTT